MKSVPIVEQLRADPPAALRREVERFAKALVAARATLRVAPRFRQLVPVRLTEGPALHLDDLSEIPRLDGGADVRFYQDRARLRAGDGDLVATCGDLVPGYEDYCRDRLGLGSPLWLRPALPRLSLRIAEACWMDRDVRSILLRRLRNGELAYMHPNMGSSAAWELARLLTDEVQRPLRVIAPHVGVARWVNDKIAFASTVSSLFGPSFVPRTLSACNHATLARHVRQLSGEVEFLGLKLPHSAGGDGNVVVDAKQYRGRSLREIHKRLRTQLRELEWDGASQLLIDHWETPVLCSPSVQMWIPPVAQGPPIIEGVFVQEIEGLRGVFVGAAPARFPHSLNQEITDRSWILGRLYQKLGYVGRCSIDLILVGDSVDDCRLEFIECNGRWGGASLYLTLMNRIFGDWSRRPFALHVAHHIPGLERVEFSQLLDEFHDVLYDARTGGGALILSNPGRLRYQSGITLLALGSSWRQAGRRGRRFADRLRGMTGVTASSV